ncbi:cobalamin B12-binding domain-containing protein [Methylobacterium sp. UNC300MFChir4.1]|uniref:cobalamin B12-binding domain-containing protein n=1 Tax=Methylobacterium sp. UNC300MFChir4.1 TaxID=1502747 RepID=UPI00147DDFE0|nr:cobalamin B12-binding domain-containing protein [Methylobacterium sp. UNC300MFChir4.1]
MTVHTGHFLRNIIEKHSHELNSKDTVASIFYSGERLSPIMEELAYQARAAIVLWEEDELSFCEVTARVAHLQMIARYLFSNITRKASCHERSILLMPCPEETHVFGLQLLGAAFHDAGWAVTMSATKPERPRVLIERHHYDVVGLSLSRESLLPLLRDEITRLRRASRNQSLRVLVGGPCFDRGDADAELVGADAYAPDAWSAPTVAGEIVNEQKLICAGILTS